jgi:hypothetical protein
MLNDNNCNNGSPPSAPPGRLQVSRPTVSLWRTRFAQGGPQSLWEIAPGRGRKAMYGPEKIQAIVEATLQSKPKGMTQWSCRPDGGGARGEQVQHQQHLAQSPSQAPPRQEFQAVP